MKKILIVFLVYFISVTSIFAKESKDYTINFNGQKYHLLYSAKNKENGGYLNEYFRLGETYNIWTDMVAVHHFSNAYSPIDRIQDFKYYLSSINCPSSLTFDDKKNSAIIDFIIINDKTTPIVLEFNVFKYEKSKKCGSIAIQYAKRYSATTMNQIEEIKKDFEKNRKKIIKKVKNFEIPGVVTEDIDKCISNADVMKIDTEIQTEDSKDIVTETAKSDVLSNQPEEAVINTEKTEINDKNADVAVISEPKNEDKEVAAVPESEPVSKVDNAENVSEDSENLAKNANRDIDSEKAEVVDAKTSDEKSEIKKEPVNEEKTVDAPIPAVTEIAKKDTKKNVKELKYKVENNKDGFYAVPRTKKQLKQEVKQKRKLQKKAQKDAKLAAKNKNIELKRETKANLKEAKYKAKEQRIIQKEEKRELKAAKRGEKIQARIDAKDYKRQIKEDKKQAKFEAKELKQQQKEDKKISRKNQKLQQKEEKKNIKQAKKDKKASLKEERKKAKSEAKTIKKKIKAEKKKHSEKSSEKSAE